MKIAALLFNILLILAVLSCTNNEQQIKTGIAANSRPSLDTSRYTIILQDTVLKVGSEEVQLLYQILNNIIDSLNKARGRKIDISEYKFQIVPVKSMGTQKICWVNSFCNGGTTNWKTEIYQVEDGGICFFNTKINLTTLTYFNLVVNSSA